MESRVVGVDVPFCNADLNLSFYKNKKIVKRNDKWKGEKTKYIKVKKIQSWKVIRKEPKSWIGLDDSNKRFCN